MVLNYGSYFIVVLHYTSNFIVIHHKIFYHVVND